MSLEIDRLYELLTQTESRYEELYSQFMQLPLDSIPDNSDLIQEINHLAQKCWDLLDRIEAYINQIKQYHSLYSRPSGWLSGLFSRPLGPLPTGMECYEIDHDVMAGLPKYRLAPIVMLAFIVVSIVVMVSRWPWLATSPFTLVASHLPRADGGADSSQLLQIILIVILACLLGLVIARPKSMKLFVYRAALREEQWFRSGAENWTPSQRLVSSIMFGLCHVVNLIYPIIVLILLMVAGVVLMRVYQAEYRRTNSTYMATMAATSFHATYNIYAFCFVIGIVGLNVIMF